MSTHNIGFYEDLTKIIFQLSSNSHLISSSVYHKGILQPIHFASPEGQGQVTDSCLLLT